MEKEMKNGIRSDKTKKNNEKKILSQTEGKGSLE